MRVAHGASSVGSPSYAAAAGRRPVPVTLPALWRCPLLPDRGTALERACSSPLDVLVVGGGITGVGIALDAVARGYRVALVERGDLASGTSSRSSKLVHGGIRYLEQRDFALVHEAARERERLRRLAPHLVRPTGFVVPTSDRAEALTMRAGLVVYDGMIGMRNVRRHRRLGRDDIVAAAPGLVRGHEHGGYLYVDCRTDDARLTLAVAGEARGRGALIVNYAEVVGLHRSAGRVVAATVRDHIAGEDHELRARWVVSATGVWADRVRRLVPDDRAGRLQPSRGVHLVLRGEDVPLGRPIIVDSATGDARRVFLVPWGEQVYVGTTDEHHTGGLDTASVGAGEAGYLLHAVNAAFGTTLTVADAVGAWAGLRPLLGGATTASTDLSRRHAVVEDPPGLVTITGGKLTTYRQMAQDVVDRLAHADGNRTRCATARIPLGARGTFVDGRDRVRAVAALHDLERPTADALYGRYGDRAPTVLRHCLDTDGLAPLVPGLPYLRGEVRWAVRSEWARTVDDVLSRRTRIALRSSDAGGDAIAFVAATLADELRWDDAMRDRQIRAYLDAVRAERGAVGAAAGPAPPPARGDVRS